MLWDVFPKEKIAGGAPMNVALHLRHLGNKVAFISKIGADKEGEALLGFIESFGLSPAHIQRDDAHPTGKVMVHDQDKENIRYEIVQPAAWDHISWSAEIQELVDRADAFIFGSLAAREETSRETLFKLLQTKTLKVLDINLRSPFYSFDVLEELLEHTDILKINEEELKVLSAHHDLSEDLTTSLDQLVERYELTMICVTLGKKGALLYFEEELINHPEYPITVQDTVGAGDAFLSAFVNSYLLDRDPENMLDDACALGALIATHKGGTPSYQLEDIDKIKAEKQQ